MPYPRGMKDEIRKTSLDGISEEAIFDLLVIGAGPTGLACAI